MSDLQDNSDLFDGFGNGSLHMYVVCTPGWEPYQQGDVRYLDMDLHPMDWEALFFGALDAHRWDQLEGESVDENRERNRRLFYESIPEFARLRTIFDMYEDYVFTQPEAEELRAECIQLKSRLTDDAAVKALRKLIYACDEAIKANCTFMLVCD